MLIKEDLLPYLQKVLTTIDEIIEDTNEKNLELVNLIKELNNCKSCNHYKVHNNCDGCALVGRKNKILNELDENNKKVNNQKLACLKDIYVHHKDIICSTEKERINEDKK